MQDLVVPQEFARKEWVIVGVREPRVVCTPPLPSGVEPAERRAAAAAAEGCLVPTAASSAGHVLAAAAAAASLSRWLSTLLYALMRPSSPAGVGIAGARNCWLATPGAYRFGLALRP